MITTTIEEKLQEILAGALNALYGGTLEGSDLVLQPTKREFEGQYTFVLFPYLRLSKKAPEATARELGEKLMAGHPEVFEKYNVVKGFLNLSLTDAFFLGQLLEDCSVEEFGVKPVADDAPLYMVEYSSPNTNKPLHLGHVRNNLLGYSIATILRAGGFRVVKTNIVNDRGIHICKSMLAWQKWGNGATPESSGMKGDQLVGEYYVLFGRKLDEEVSRLMSSEGLTKEEAEARSPLMAEVHDMLRKWEEGDPGVRSLWQMMNGWVYDGFAVTYKALGVDFDKIYYESDTYLAGKEEVLRGLKEGIFVQDPDGSVWADLTDAGLDRKILLRSDGTSVYITQDIGTAKKRFADYPIDHMVYVVGNEQEYHFQVLSIILDRLGFEFGKDLRHFSYGMVSLPDGSKIKSREGTRVDADDLIRKMIDQAYEVSSNLEKMTDMPEEERREVSRIVGLGALKYFLLKVDPKKNMLFDPFETINFNGNTGPFIQYAYARIRSLLRLAEERGIAPLKLLPEYPVTLSDKEVTLIQRLDGFRSVIETAASEMNPGAVANYVYDLVKEFNQFYHELSVLGEKDETKRALRLSLSDLTARVVKQGLSLLGIEAPERM